MAGTDTTKMAYEMAEKAREIIQEGMNETTMARLEVCKIHLMAIQIETIDDLCFKLRYLELAMN